MFLISFASAWDWDNVQTTYGENPNTGYPNIEVKNAFGLGETLFEGSLNEHTPTCGEYCTSKIEINHSGGEFIQDIRFLTDNSEYEEVCTEEAEICTWIEPTHNATGYNSCYTPKTCEDVLIGEEVWIEQDIRSYRFKYEAELPEYETECEETGETSENGTAIIECNQVQTGTYTGFKTYNVGEDLPEGHYEIFIEGEKKPSRKVDWQVKIHGEWLEAWAVWGDGTILDDLTAYYKVDNNDFSDTHNSYDLTNSGTTNTSGILIDGRSFDGSND